MGFAALNPSYGLRVPRARADLSASRRYRGLVDVRPMDAHRHNLVVRTLGGATYLSPPSYRLSSKVGRHLRAAPRNPRSIRHDLDIDLCLLRQQLPEKTVQPKISLLSRTWITVMRKTPLEIV